MRAARIQWWVLVSFLGGFACSEDPGSDASAGFADAAAVADSSGFADAMVIADSSGFADAEPGEPDGADADAAELDAAPADAALEDAALEDAALEDAALEDAALEDAAESDGGGEDDSGLVEDDGGIIDAATPLTCNLPTRDAGVLAPDATTCDPLPWNDPVLRISTRANQTQSNANSYDGKISGDGLSVAYETFESTLIAPGFSPGIAATEVGGAPNAIWWNYDYYEISKSGDRVGLYENGSYYLFNIDGSGGSNVFLDRFNQNAGYADEATLAPNARQIMFRTLENDLDYRSDPSGMGAYVRNLDTQTNFKIPDHRLREEDGWSELFWKQNGRVLSFWSGVANRSGIYNPTLDAFYLLDTRSGVQMTDDLEENIASSAIASVPADTNMVADVYAFNIHTQAVERLSVSAAGVQGNGASTNPSFSDDRRFVAFASAASNLVPNDTNGNVSDVLVRDRRYNLLYRLSSDAAGASGDALSTAPMISADGRAVVFNSRAGNLVAGDTNNRDDVFVAKVPHVECTPGFDGGVSPDAGSGDAGIQPVPSTALTKGTHPVANDSASTVIFWSRDGLVARDTNGHADLYAHDVAGGTNTLLSAPAAGAANGPTRSVFSASADANIVAFYSDASNLVAADTNNRPDIFVLNRTTNTITRILGLAGAQPNGDSFDPSISADGRFVAFESQASNLVAADLNGVSDVFVADLLLGTIELASVNSAGVQADGPSTAPVISGDGAVVAFDSYSSNLTTPPPSTVTTGAYLRDRLAGTTSGELTGGPTMKKALSFDGDVFAFQVMSCCLGPSSFAWSTIGVYDRTTGTYAPDFVSFGDHSTYLGNLSAGGRYLAFWSEAEDLVPGDHNHRPDVFIRDQLTGALARISVSTDGREATDVSALPRITSDGRYLVYATAASELSGLEGGIGAVILTANPLECP